MRSLERQAKEAMRAIADRFDRGSRTSSTSSMMMERDLIILYGMYHGWSNRVIAETLRCHPRTVSRHSRQLILEPKLIFRCPVLHQGLRGIKKLWRCEVCSASMLGSERKAREHVASHFFSKEMIAFRGVMPDD